jgi:rubrerythrin
MSLSQKLEEGLIDCFILRVRKPKELKFPFIVGGTWFCPACGIKMFEKNGDVRCSQCNLSLNEFIHQLVELHPHASVK